MIVNRSRYGLFACTMLLTIVLFVVSLVPVLGQGERVPLNGNFPTNLADWGRINDSISWNSDGVNGGAVQVCGMNEGVLSSPVEVGAGAILKFYTKGAGFMAFKIWDYNVSGTVNTWLTTVDEVTLHQWDLSNYVGDLISVMFWGNDGWGRCTKFSDVQVTNSTNGYRPDVRYANGTFTGSSFGYVFRSAPAAWDGSVGRTALGSLETTGCCGFKWFRSRRVRVSSTSVSFWTRSSGNEYGVAAYWYPMNGNLGYALLGAHGGHTSADWIEHVIDTSGIAPSEGYFDIGLGSDSGLAWLDDFCPVGGCSAGTPTPTMILATPTTGGGGGATSTPGGPGPTIIFPTFPPWPTFPPYPTQGAYPTFPPWPTVDYGWSTPYVVTFGGTPQPVIVMNTVVITGNVQVDNWPTPIYGKGTPMPVYFPTKEMTPWSVPTNAGGVGGLGVTIGGVIGSADTGSISGVMPFATSGGQQFEMPGAHIDERQLGFCFPTQVTQIIGGSVPVCFNFTIWEVTRFSILGVNLLVPLGAIMIAFFFVFIARQIQRS